MEERIKELEKRVETLERRMWSEQMADFLDWDYYDKLKKELAEVKKELKELGVD